MFLNILQKSLENNYPWKHLKRLFLLKSHTEACNIIKKDSNSDVFLWILRSFWEQLFYRIIPVAATEMFR